MSSNGEEPESSEDEIVYIREPRLPDIVRSGPFEYGSRWHDGRGSQLMADGSSRCDSERLMYLLTYVDPGPLLTKKGKPRVRQPAPHVDENAEFYAAQVVHYGLKSSGEGKEGDKKVLLEYARRNGGEFVVPREIAEIRVKLKNEWDVKYREWKEEMNTVGKKIKERKERKELKRKRKDEEELDNAFGEEYSAKRVKVEKPKPINLDSLSGVYTIAVPSITKNFDYDPPTLMLCLSSSGSHMWGTFNFGIFKGKLRSEKLDKDSFKDTIKFHWRGRYHEAESMTESENIAHFSFLDDKVFRGDMWSSYSGTFELAGKRNIQKSQGVGLSSKVRDWKRKYRQLNDANYDAECSNRWGGWITEAEPDKPKESDTTVGSEDEDEDEDKDKSRNGLTWADLYGPPRRL